MRPAISAVVCVLVLGVSCGGGEKDFSADAPMFKGLPPTNVEEALANPHVQSSIDLPYPDPAERESVVQAEVRNMIFCREALRVYQGWIQTGEPPAISPGPMPDDPLEPGNSAMIHDYANLKRAANSGEPSQVAALIGGAATCGDWVPATPGDVQGSTISEVVQGLQT